VVTVFDSTLSHVGWAGGSFAAGGWEDRVPPLVTGVPATSWWWQSLNGIAIDVALQLLDSSGNALTPLWTNTHQVGPLQGSVPSPVVVTSNARLRVYNRTPSNTNPILLRVVSSDQPVTPPPTTPP